MKGKTNQEIHDYLIEGEKLILMRSKLNGTIQYMLLKDYVAENTTFGNRLDEFIEAVPSSYFSSEASSFSEVSEEEAKTIIENENKGIYDGDVNFEGKKDIVDFKLPEKNNTISIDVPVETGSKGLNLQEMDKYSPKYNDITIDDFRSKAYHELGK